MHFILPVALLAVLSSADEYIPNYYPPANAMNVWKKHDTCCAVWSFVRNKCIERSKAKNGLCYALNEPPGGVPADCGIWNMRKTRCEEIKDGREDGFYVPAGAHAVGDPDVDSNGYATDLPVTPYSSVPMPVTVTDTKTETPGWAQTVHVTVTVAPSMAVQTASVTMSSFKPFIEPTASE